MATLAEVRTWAAAVSSQRDMLTAQIAAERARALPVVDVERRLRLSLLAHLRHEAALLRARARFLAAADAAMVAEEAHPAASMKMPASVSGSVGTPRTPSRRLAL